MKHFWNNLLFVVSLVCFLASATMLVLELSDLPRDDLAAYEPGAHDLQILELVNEVREGEGLQPLELDPQMCALAYVRAREAAELWSHTRPNGLECHSVYEEYGIDRDFWTGENLAGYALPDARQTVDSWLESEAHRINILYPDYTAAGIAVYHSGDRYYVANLFRS